MTKDRANELAWKIFMEGKRPFLVATQAERDEVHAILRQHPGWTFHDALLELC